MKRANVQDRQSRRSSSQKHEHGRTGTDYWTFLSCLLRAEGAIPAEVRQALLAGRRQDAAEMLMQQYRLSCDEASDLLDVFARE